MEDNKQPVEQETLEKKVQEREERDAAERQLVARRDIEPKQWAENVPPNKKRFSSVAFSPTQACAALVTHAVTSMPPVGTRLVCPLSEYAHDWRPIAPRRIQNTLNWTNGKCATGTVDALAKLLMFRHLVQLNICCNTARQLRGNVYVEYQTARQAADAREGFFGRWYGGW
ncbi:Aste57867_22289 [Aphanomyces stellatus]|uniref:Aste57867_22289 protein n=1 Tax=Aphanomyces stellatus TaxID=120398 RepID=A0A485LPN1_9STRA|nr:hypothetical protein As57867_022219 [Aphanomyces stellatus]VFT98955.1 Aste57867_22289 [Aphanomyces stellatus]